MRVPAAGMLPGLAPCLFPETPLSLLKFALSATALAALLSTAHAQTSAPLKVGLMLPATGTFAALGDAIEKGFKLYVDEQGGKLGGRSIQYFKVDDESDPARPPTTSTS
jgi:branched-chain amino acid transport system substrate-binding protein